VDLDLLDEQRVNGSVIPLQDLIKDAYDNVVHYSDYKGQKTAEAVPAEANPDGLDCDSLPQEAETMRIPALAAADVQQVFAE
jgi:hypothetical protein